MTINNKYVTEDKEFKTINELFLHRRKDGLFYKKHAKKPFSGIALTYGAKGRLTCRTNFKDGLRHGLTEGFSPDNSQPLFKTTFNQGIVDLSQGREIFGEGHSSWRTRVENGITIEEEFDVKGRLLKITYFEQENGPFDLGGMYNATNLKARIH
jgi:antitoxin component YwqK of YwqJK toxin-antitoxin module